MWGIRLTVVGGSPSSLRKSVSLEFTKLSSRLDSYAEQIYNPTDTENRQNTEGCKIIVITRSGGSNTEAMPVADQMVLAAPSVPKFLLASKDNTSAAHHWMVPYSRNRLFTGRKSTVEELDALASDSSYRRIALYGLGGIGYVITFFVPG